MKEKAETWVIKLKESFQKFKYLLFIMVKGFLNSVS